jgi:4-amino-4-deoxy-L-arabinose transferase-like glycosyltransferase
VLAKGPVALVLCGGAIFFWGIFTKRWREVFRLLHPVAVIAFCAAALPWYVLCARRNPEFFHVFIVEHNFKRYLTPEFQHIQPFWFYAPVLLVALLPWTAMLLWVSVAGVREFIRRRRVSEATGLLICWAGFCAVFFSASHSKLPGYILPAIPAIGLLMTHVYVSMGDRLHRSFRAAHLAAAAILFGGLGVAELLTRNSSHVHAISVGAAGMVIALWAVANLIMGWFAGAASNKNSLGEFWAALSVAPILVAMLSAGQLLPRFFHGDPSGRSIAREVQRQRIPMKALAVSGMNRAQEYSLSFYLHEEIKDWNPSSETGGYLLTAAQNCEAVVGARFYCELERFESEGTGRFLYLVIPIAGEK